MNEQLVQKFIQSVEELKEILGPKAAPAAKRRPPLKQLVSAAEVSIQHKRRTRLAKETF